MLSLYQMKVKIKDSSYFCLQRQDLSTHSNCFERHSSFLFLLSDRYLDKEEIRPKIINTFCTQLLEWQEKKNKNKTKKPQPPPESHWLVWSHKALIKHKHLKCAPYPSWNVYVQGAIKTTFALKNKHLVLLLNTGKKEKCCSWSKEPLRQTKLQGRAHWLA